MAIMKIVGIFRQIIKIWYIPVHSILYLWFRTSSIVFSPITLHAKVALNSKYLFVIGAKPFPANQNVKYEHFSCTFQILHIFAGNVYWGPNKMFSILPPFSNSFESKFCHLVPIFFYCVPIVAFYERQSVIWANCPICHRQWYYGRPRVP